MAFNVLVVDDSAFYRRSLRKLIDEDPMLHVVGEAKNGSEAIALAEKLQPDVITMDVEMPVLDGISAVRCIMDNTPLPILMFSSLTHSGAQATLDALDAGALDFFPKKFDDISDNNTHAINALRTKIRLLARRKAILLNHKRALKKHLKSLLYEVVQLYQLIQKTLKKCLCRRLFHRANVINV